MSSTKTTTADTKNHYERMPGATSPDIDALRATHFQVDPTIVYRVGGAIRRQQNQFNNPAGGYTTPQMRDAIGRSQERELMQEGGAQFRAGAHDVNSQNFQKNAYLASLTAPPLVQTGGSTTEKYKTPFSAKILPAIQAGAQA